jgi:hypothetical protein
MCLVMGPSSRMKGVKVCQEGSTKVSPPILQMETRRCVEPNSEALGQGEGAEGSRENGVTFFSQLHSCYRGSSIV